MNKENIEIKIFFLVNGVITLASGIIGGILVYNSSNDLEKTICTGILVPILSILVLIIFWFFFIGTILVTKKRMNLSAKVF